MTDIVLVFGVVYKVVVVKHSRARSLYRLIIKYILNHNAILDSLHYNVINLRVPLEIFRKLFDLYANFHRRIYFT